MARDFRLVLAGLAAVEEMMIWIHCEKRWVRHTFRSADVADEQSVYRFSQVILEEMGTPDLLLNNAAIINQNAPLWKVPSDEFHS